MKAVEALNYRVTAGDVASHAGVEINLAEQKLLALASEAGGHMQVSETGEIAYQFPKNFRAVLFTQSARLRWQQRLTQLWRILFYLIRISFGIILIALLIFVVMAIVALLIAMSSSRDDNNGNSNDYGRGGPSFIPLYWLSPDWYLIFTPDYYSRRRSQRQRSGEPPKLNFLEAVFSFLFGDGNPNADLEERRWRAIATVIRNHDGAVAAEQIAPYLDTVDRPSQDDEDYMLPVLTRFNGLPEVTPEGQLVYRFPELQVSAEEKRTQSVSAYLKEAPWRFSQATSGQIMLATGLGAGLIAGGLVLGNLLQEAIASGLSGSLVGLITGGYSVAIGYGIGFLAIPLIRYLWIQRRNKRVEARNEARLSRAEALLNADETVQHKLNYARQFATQTIVRQSDVVYTTETDLTEQELARKEQIDAEWRDRLEQSGH